VLSDSSAKTVEQGVKVLEEGTKVVRDMGGIFGEIFGRENEVTPEKKNP
jgi:hypothetical protein